MILKYLILVIAITISSCIPVYFEEPQTYSLESLSYFPEELRGEYIANGGADMVITDSSYTHPIEIFGSSDEIALSGPDVLKRIDDRYIFSEKDLESEYWMVYLLSFQSDSILQVSYISGDHHDTVIKLKEITRTIESIGEEGLVEFYVVNPTEEEFRKMIVEGLFSSSIFFKKK